MANSEDTLATTKNNTNQMITNLLSQSSSRMGERTPGAESCEQNSPGSIATESSDGGEGNPDLPISPQSIHVRDIPLPCVSWADTTELSTLMCYKEEISLLERDPHVFRRNPNLNPRMRTILFEWLMEVCEVYKMRRVTYYLAIDYVDRYISKTDFIRKNHLQLLGITSLFIAAKVEEIYPPKLAELAYVTDGACNEEEMLEKEVSILMELRWDVQPITCSGWLTLYLQLACSNTNIRETLTRMSQLTKDDFIYPQFSTHLFMTASMLMDLCSLDDGMMQFKYSILAASVIYYVVSREKALYVSGFTWEVLEPCIKWMHPFVLVFDRIKHTQPIGPPKQNIPLGSSLRVLNPNIISDEGYALQNHLVSLSMLEEVQKVREEMAEKYENGNDNCCSPKFHKDSSCNPISKLKTKKRTYSHTFDTEDSCDDDIQPHQKIFKSSSESSVSSNSFDSDDKIAYSKNKTKKKR